MRIRRPRKLVVERGSLASFFAGEPPFAAVSRLDAGAHRVRHIIALLATLGAHGAIALAVLFQHVEGDHPPPRAPRREIAASIVHPPPPPPKPPAPSPHPEARAPRAAARAPPPPPAQAARAIAVEGPADLTSFDLVVGTGTSYAGGATSATGKRHEAVHDAGNGPPKSDSRAAPDLSRAAALLDRDWSCAWPEEAQDSDLRDARVTMRVHVDRSGAPEQIEIIGAPSGGFAEAARRCAEGARYRVALDPSGAPIAAPTALFNVHFLR